MSPAVRGLAGAATQRGRLRSDNRTGYKGVIAQDGRYRAQIAHHGRKIALGMFDTPEDAARAYDVAALQLYGPDAWTDEAKGGAAR